MEDGGISIGKIIGLVLSIAGIVLVVAFMFMLFNTFTDTTDTATGQISAVSDSRFSEFNNSTVTGADVKRVVNNVLGDGTFVQVLGKSGGDYQYGTYMAAPGADSAPSGFYFLGASGGDGFADCGDVDENTGYYTTESVPFPETQSNAVAQMNDTRSEYYVGDREKFKANWVLSADGTVVGVRCETIAE